MDDTDLEASITSIADLVDAGQLEDAHALAALTDAALVAQPDPTLYGWLTFYRLRLAHSLELWDEVVRTFPPRFSYLLSLVNAAWVLSVKAEAATRLGAIDEVVSCLERCIAIRRELGDTDAVFAAARTACELLHELGRDDLNTPFLPIMIHEARFAGDERHATYGYLALVRNIVATSDPRCIDTLLEARAFLARCEDDAAAVAFEFARTAPEVAQRIATMVTARHRAVRGA